MKKVTYRPSAINGKIATQQATQIINISHKLRGKSLTSDKRMTSPAREKVANCMYLKRKKILTTKLTSQTAPVNYFAQI